MGYEPRITVTTWQVIGQSVILPRGLNEGIACGNAAPTLPASIAFVLCFGNEDIELMLLFNDLFGFLNT